MSNANQPDSASSDRYSRQILFDRIGQDGQSRLGQARVTLIGCGALGTVLANTLVRAGVGYLKICDRDFIEPNNLQRQVLFDEEDIAAGLPKAEAAARKLRRINSSITVDPIVADANPTNIENLCADADLLLDGTDNFETRFLINDLAVQSQRPWVYGAVIGATGLCMSILPNDTPCLRCVFEETPPPEFSPTCDTAGVLGPTVNIVASLQAIEAIKILTGQATQITRGLMSIDVWSGRLQTLNVQSAFEQGKCPCCRKGEYPYLQGSMHGGTTSLCGRHAVQVRPPRSQPLDLAKLGERLQSVAGSKVMVNEFLLRADIDDYEVTLFADGRAIIKGTDRAETARAVYARYIGG